MKKLELGSSFVVFALFFGVATLEAFQTRNWLKAVFWLSIGIVFLVADNMKREGKQGVSRRTD
jgi:cell division protein FtsW (lipid II flippase)